MVRLIDVIKKQTFYQISFENNAIINGKNRSGIAAVLDSEIDHLDLLQKLLQYVFIVHYLLFISS